MCDKLEVDHLWFKLINVLDSAKDSQKEQINEILVSLVSHREMLKDLLNQYPLYAFKCEDDSIRIEWHFINLIVVWDIEENIKESCWTITSTKEAGNYSKGFYFTDLESIKNGCEEIITMIKNQIDYL